MPTKGSGSVDMSSGAAVVDYGALIRLLVEAFEIGGSYNDRQAALCRQIREALGDTFEEPPALTTDLPDEDGTFQTVPTVTDSNGNVHSFG